MPSLPNFPGYLNAGKRLISNHTSIRAAWESLELGVSYDEASEYLKFPLAGHAKPGSKDRVLGVCVAFGILAVEAERERVNAQQQTQ